MTEHLSRGAAIAEAARFCRANADGRSRGTATAGDGEIFAVGDDEEIARFFYGNDSFGMTIEGL